MVDVQVEWNGAKLYGHMGEHIVKCIVTCLASRFHKDGWPVMMQCFLVPFLIYQWMLVARQSCDATLMSSLHIVCVNMIENYKCVCPLLSLEESTTNVQVNVDAGWAIQQSWCLQISAGMTVEDSATLSQQLSNEHQVFLQYKSINILSIITQHIGLLSQLWSSLWVAFVCPIDPCQMTKMGHSSCKSSNTCVVWQLQLVSTVHLPRINPVIPTCVLLVSWGMDMCGDPISMHHQIQLPKAKEQCANEVKLLAISTDPLSSFFQRLKIA